MLAMKAHVCHPWQNYSFCRDEQAQGSPTTRSNQDNLAHVLIPASKDHLSNRNG